MKKTAMLLMAITVFSKLIGFSREIILSYFYGASNVSDAYLVSSTVPTIIFSFIGAGISIGYIPIYSKIVKQKGAEEGEKYTNNLISWLMILSTGIVIFGFIFTGPIVKMIALGFEGQTFELAVKFTRISLLGIYFTGLISIFVGFLQVHGNYAIPALIGFPMNLVTILSIFLSYKINLVMLPIGAVIATVSQLILLIPFIYKKGYKYKFILDIKDEYMKNMVYIALPVMIGISVNQINVIVDRTLASNITVGGITALTYANRLTLFVQGMFVITIATVLYPIISKMAAEDNIDGLKKSISESINLTNLLVIPTTVGGMLFAEPIIRLLFGRGAFDYQAIHMTSVALFYYSIGMLGFGLREVLSRGFYSLQDTKTPMINGIISMLINILLNILLSKYMGISGLALATSISAILCTALLFRSFRRKMGSFGMKSIIISSIKILFASLVMGILAKLNFNYLTLYIGQNLALLISIAAGGITYFVIIYFMKIEDVDVAVNAVKKRFVKTTE